MYQILLVKGIPVCTVYEQDENFPEDEFAHPLEDVIAAFQLYHQQMAEQVINQKT